MPLSLQKSPVTTTRMSNGFSATLGSYVTVSRFKPRLTTQNKSSNCRRNPVLLTNTSGRFVGGKPIKHRFQSLNEIPSTARESDAMSKDLQKKGLRFVGPTICYAFMQAVGMVNDHTSKCFRYDMV